jgi:hypothetical protein
MMQITTDRGDTPNAAWNILISLHLGAPKLRWELVPSETARLHMLWASAALGPKSVVRHADRGVISAASPPQLPLEAVTSDCGSLGRPESDTARMFALGAFPPMTAPQPDAPQSVRSTNNPD